MRNLNLYYQYLVDKKTGNKIAIRDDFQLKHLKVLRAGNRPYNFSCRDGKGLVAELEYLKMNKEEGALFAITSMDRDPIDYRFRAILPVIRPAAMEQAIDQLTQIGNLQELVLYFADNSRHSENKISANKIKRLEKIALSSFVQAGADLLPEVGVEDSLAAALDGIAADLSLALDFSGDRISIESDQISAAANNSNGTINLIVGSEGGFSDVERELLVEQGIKSYQLPTTILTAETAIYSLALLTKTFLSR